MNPAPVQVPRHTYNAPSLHTGWTIQQIVTAEYHIPEVLNHDLTTPTPAAWIEVSNAAFVLGKTNNSSSRFTHTFRVRHPSCSLTVRISLQRPTFGTILLHRTRASQVGASLWFISVAFWVCLELLGPARGVTTAHRAFSGRAPLNIPSQFFACCSMLALKMCLSLSHCQGALTRLHVHDPPQSHPIVDTSTQKKDIWCTVAFRLDEKWWTDSMECYCYLRNVQDLADGKTPYERRFEVPFEGPVIPFCSTVEHLFAKDPINLVRKFHLEYVSGLHCSREEFGKDTYWSHSLRSWKFWTGQKSMFEGSMQRKC